MLDEKLNDLHARSGRIIRAAIHVEQNLELALALRLTNSAAYARNSLCSDILDQFTFGKKIELYLKECKRWLGKEECANLEKKIKKLNELRNAVAHSEVMQDAETKELVVIDGKSFTKTFSLTESMMNEVESDRSFILKEIWRLFDLMKNRPTPIMKVHV